jgi:hypothetical protein
LRLSSGFRLGLYAVLTLLFVTGVAWLVADWQKAILASDTWQAIAAWSLMVHGGGAMAILLLLGALLPLHVYRAWRGRRNRASGALMVTLNSVLIATAFGLYYSGSDAIRFWTSNIHIAVGLLLPVFLVAHIALGRRSRPAVRPDDSIPFLSHQGSS